MRRVVRIILAGDPVYGRIEMRAGVLAAADVVPVPGRTARVGARNLLQRKSLRWRELLGQADRLRVCLQRNCEINDSDAAAQDAVDQSGETLRMVGQSLS